MNTRYCIMTLFATVAMAAGAQTRKPFKAKVTPATTTARTKSPAMTTRAKALYNEMLPNTQKVFFVDSTVVDIDKTLDAVYLPKAYGTFVSYDKFFGKESGYKSYVFVNGFGNRCYYTELAADSTTMLYMCDKLGDGWGKPRPIKTINDSFTDISFPYMSSDGQTLYFSGVSKTDGLGKRDIYMTKYDADEDNFLQAENIGLPFNSAYDDYLLVEADADKIGWFASTRGQAAGKACIYTFVPAESRQNYDADELSARELEAYAAISSIRATWPSAEQRNQAMTRIARLKKSAAKAGEYGYDVAFVVNDDVTYTSVDEFRSDETRKDFYDIRRQQTEIRAAKAKLDNLRTRYHGANASDRTALGGQIARLEQNVEEASTALKKSENELRAKENRLLRR